MQVDSTWRTEFAPLLLVMAKKRPREVTDLDEIGDESIPSATGAEPTAD